MNPLEKYDEELKQVLRNVGNGVPIDDLSQDEIEKLKVCVDDGLIIGVLTGRMLSGRVTSEYTDNVQLTREGLYVLYGGEDRPNKGSIHDSTNEQAQKSSNLSFIIRIVELIAAIAAVLIPLSIHFGWI